MKINRIRVPTKEVMTNPIADEFQGQLGKYRLIQTDDGSHSLWSEKFDENCHSTTGAYAETILHYIEGTKVLERVTQKGQVSILEVGFGTAMGIYATYREIASLPFLKNTKFISTELDKDLILWAKNRYSEHELIGKLKRSDYFGIPAYEAKTPEFHLIVLVGDAYETLSLLKEKAPLPVDAIYQDAFSPKKNPDLWTVEWFQLLKEFSNQQTLMGTYSSSVNIRKSMIEAGWKVFNGPAFGPKRSSTRASLVGDMDPELTTMLSKSPIATLHRNKN